MKYLILLLLLASCAKTPDIVDKLWHKIKTTETISKSDKKIIDQARDAEWKEVDKDTEKVIIPKKKPIK